MLRFMMSHSGVWDVFSTRLTPHDVYILRHALCLHPPLHDGGGSRRRRIWITMVRYALVAVKSYSLYEWACARGMPAHDAVLDAIESNNVSLFQRVWQHTGGVGSTPAAITMALMRAAKTGATMLDACATRVRLLTDHVLFHCSLYVEAARYNRADSLRWLDEHYSARQCTMPVAYEVNDLDTPVLYADECNTAAAHKALYSAAFHNACDALCYLLDHRNIPPSVATRAYGYAAANCLATLQVVRTLRRRRVALPMGEAGERLVRLALRNADMLDAFETASLLVNASHRDAALRTGNVRSLRFVLDALGGAPWRPTGDDIKLAAASNSCEMFEYVNGGSAAVAPTELLEAACRAGATETALHIVRTLRAVPTLACAAAACNFAPAHLRIATVVLLCNHGAREIVLERVRELAELLPRSQRSAFVRAVHRTACSIKAAERACG